ncbi:MAG: GTPase HflX [Betaproteobacteria bacterium]|nr:GTPase HflX [Betaproteobacteria bacterium]
MLDRPGSGDAAILVGLDFGEPDYAGGLQELHELAVSAGLKVLASLGGRRAKPDPACFAGSGKVEEIARVAAERGAGVVVFNHELTPVQERNLEQRLRARVVDRTSLILDIFAQRARSHEGKLQVELAQLEHLSTRLVRGWTHLERQKGGIGLRGPGETQLETDRRLLGRRVKVLREKLAQLRRQRAVQRRARERGDVCTVSLVGYTNAGKSTLFNRLTHASAFCADQLFATLDTMTRRVFIETRPLVLSDTVGFIKSLPHTLVEAFRATLEETVYADLLLHVVDMGSPAHEERIEEVNKVLAEIGANHIPQIIVHNKIDVKGLLPGVDRDEYGKIERVRVSARTGEGIDLLREALKDSARPVLSSDPREARAGRAKPPVSASELGLELGNG